MNVKVVCLPVCLLVCLIVAVQSAVAGQSDDTLLSRHKRDFVEDIFDGLKKSFSKTVVKVLELKGEAFKKVIKGVKKLGVSTAKKIYGFFKDFSSKSHDLVGEKAIRVDQLMEALTDDIQEKENTSGATSATISLLIAAILALIAMYFTR